MLSHELAQLLLSRRNNDVRFKVHLDTGNPEHYRSSLVSLLGDDDLINADMREAGRTYPTRYDSGLDALVIDLGVIVVNDPEDAD